MGEARSSDTVGGFYGIMRGMSKLRENLPNCVHHLIGRVTLHIIVPVGKDSPASSRRAYKLIGTLAPHIF